MNNQPKTTKLETSLSSKLQQQQKLLQEILGAIAKLKVADKQTYLQRQELTKKQITTQLAIDKLQRDILKQGQLQAINKLLSKLAFAKDASKVYEQLLDIAQKPALVPYKHIAFSKLQRYHKKMALVQLKLDTLSYKGKESLQDRYQKHFESFQFRSQDLIDVSNNKINYRLLKRLDHLKKPVDQKGYDAKKHVIFLRGINKYYYNKQFAVNVLRDVDLTINYGEVVVILGPSGSGKTTLLNLISGMDNATYGTCYVANNNLTNLNANQLTKFRKNNIGYVFQQYGLLPGLTVKENTEIGQNLQVNHTNAMPIDEILKMIGIYEHQDKYPAELSGGQQQRVSIARSVAKNPSILFADEPTGAVDELTSKQIIDLFLLINQRLKTTIVMVTHNPDFAKIASKVIQVNNGKIAKVTINKNPSKTFKIKCHK